MKKYKVVNIKRLLTSSLLLISLIAGIIILTANESLSCVKTKYKEVEAISGDTLWNIAEDEQIYNEYYNNKDIRYIISDLKLVNNLEDSTLEIGQKIIVPYV